MYGLKSEIGLGVNPRHVALEVQMSEEMVTAFTEHMEGKDELQGQLQARVGEATSEAIARFAAEHGFEFTGEEFSGMISREVSELSEDELDAVAGGLATNRPTLPLVETAAGGMGAWASMKAGQPGAQALPNMRRGFKR